MQFLHLTFELLLEVELEDSMASSLELLAIFTGAGIWNTVALGL